MKINYIFFIIFFYFLPEMSNAQHTATIINKGNKAYRAGDFAAAINLYKAALKQDPNEETARFNLANAFQKQKEYEASVEEYKKTKPGSTQQILAASAYNKGLALIKIKKIDEAIAAFTAALRLTPDDKNTRENLVRALREKQNEQNRKPKKENKPQKQLNKDLMEDKFNQLRNEEKNLQKQLNKKAQNGQPEKDW